MIMVRKSEKQELREKAAELEVLYHCASCEFWGGEVRPFGIERLTKKEGECHRQPKPMNTPRFHWCGEWRKA